MAVAPDRPDYTNAVDIIIQSVYLQLINQWQAQLNEFWSVVVDSGVLGAGVAITVNNTVPVGETWYVSQCWGNSCVTANNVLLGAEIVLLNATTVLHYAYMTLSRIGSQVFPLTQPFRADAGQVLRAVINNTTGGNNRYYAGFAGYRACSKKPPKDWNKVKKLRKFLDQRWFNTIFYEMGFPKPRVTVANVYLKKKYKFEIEDFQGPNEKGILLEEEPIGG